jgi:hypothetical protein
MRAMTKNAKTVLVVAITAFVLLVVVYFAIDFAKGRQRCFDCGDGQRCTIDTRQFATQYSAYSLELEASVKAGNKISAKVSRVQLQTLTESMQSANEFRKYVVSGFNSCAITKTQYARIGERFQAIDGLAREINDLTTKTALTRDESGKLSGLIQQYGDLVHNLGTE